MLAQLATTARKLPRAGAALLVLTSGNVVSKDRFPEESYEQGY
jgi:hypothetical protein